MTIGQKLKAARVAAGLSQVAAMPLVGIDNSHISKIETGQDHPSLETLVRMCAAYGVPLREILPNEHPWRNFEVAATDRERAWLEWFRTRPPEQREAMFQAIIGKAA